MPAYFINYYLMKKLFLIVSFVSFTSSVYCQALFKYGNYAVSKDEFLKAYNKNKTAAVSRDQAIKDYLDLYIKFKLKVQAAKDIHLDTLPSLQADLQNFRGQIEESYLKDEQQVNALVDEAFNRSRKDIHVQHFYVSINEKMAPPDTLKLYQAINETYEELKKGGTDYEGILSEIKEKIGQVHGNDMGLITVFTLPYEFENIVYGLKPGQVSKPYRSKKGWHIFKNEDERPAVGKIKAAQILFAVPAGNIVMRDRAKQLADSVYAALKAGGDFGSMAKLYSNDKMTYMSGGIMPEFGVAKYDGSFERVAFSLKNDSDISEPFQTEFGYHIIKRISRSPIPENKDNETYMYNLRQDVMKDSRIEIAREKFVKEVLAKISYKKNTLVNEKDLWKITDTFAISNKKISSGNVNEKTILFSFDNEKVKAGDWMQYARNVKNTYAAHAEQSYPDLLKNYVSIAALENYRKRLQNFNNDFRYQLEEFKEGNMLFEVMERRVWAKASADSIGLRQYYNEHKTSYTWNASADAVLFSCSNATVAKDATQKIAEGKNWKDLTNENSAQIQADSGRYELSQVPASDKAGFKPGLITEPVINSGDGTAVFSMIIRLYPGNQQRSFEDARGFVINDYQNFMEKKWIEELKKKYPVKINDKVYQSLLK
jgi:peptidyl-prolyl cis-trans isomerase SurA